MAARSHESKSARTFWAGVCLSVLPGPSGALSGEGHSGATDGVGDPSAMASDRIRCIRPAGTSRFDARPDELARVGCLAVVTDLRVPFLRSASEPGKKQPHYGTAGSTDSATQWLHLCGCEEVQS